MQTFLSSLLQFLGLRGNARPAIETELLSAVTPGGDPFADLQPPPPRAKKRRVVVAKQRTLADAMNERLEQFGDSLIGGAARIDAIYNSVSRLGGASDKGATALPDTSRTPLGMEHLDVLYRYSAYGRRVVDIVADEETRKGWKVTDGSQAVDVLAEEVKRLQLSQRINQARKWARHAGGSLILMVVDEEADPKIRRASDQLRQPLDLARVKRLRNLLVLD
ncbi:MAG: anti-CBASS protein Acb1 family protein, partial [Baekduiaceae bacterium]